MSGAWIVAAKRTAVAPRHGALAALAVHDLAAPLIQAILAETGLAPDSVDDIILGNALYGGGNPARVAGLAAGVPVVPFGYGPKQDALVTSVGLPPGVDIDTFVPAELAALVAEAVRRRDVLAAGVGGHLARARVALAAEHDRIAAALRGDAPRKREVAA